MATAQLLIALGALALAGAATAESVPSPAPGAIYAQSFTDQNLYGGSSQTLYSFGTASSNISIPAGFAEGSVSVLGGQTLSANYSASGTNNYAIEQGRASYNFAVFGPSGYEVPILLSGASGITRSNGGGASVFESVYVNGSGGLAFSQSCDGGNYIGGCGGRTYDQGITLASSTESTFGDLGTVALEIDLGGYEGSASGFIDPFLMIDPQFAQAGQFHIVFAPGVTNGGGAVPEPAAWALMLAGFGLVGARLRHSKRQSADA